MGGCGQRRCAPRALRPPPPPLLGAAETRRATDLGGKNGQACAEFLFSARRSPPPPPSLDPPPQTKNWAPRTHKSSDTHRPHSRADNDDPTHSAEGRTSDCAGPRKETNEGRGVTQGEGGGFEGVPGTFIALRGGILGPVASVTTGGAVIGDEDSVVSASCQVGVEVVTARPLLALLLMQTTVFVAGEFRDERSDAAEGQCAALSQNAGLIGELGHDDQQGAAHSPSMPRPITCWARRKRRRQPVWSGFCEGQCQDWGGRSLWGVHISCCGCIVGEYHAHCLDSLPVPVSLAWPNLRQHSDYDRMLVSGGHPAAQYPLLHLPGKLKPVRTPAANVLTTYHRRDRLLHIGGALHFQTFCPQRCLWMVPCD